MNIPSRLMPKYIPQKPNKFGILFFVILFAASAFYSPIILVFSIVLIFSAVTCSYFEGPKIDRYFSELRKSRDSLSLCDFAREFDRTSVDPWIIRATYEQVQDYLGSDRLIPIISSDKLEEDLLIDEEDLSLDLVEEIAERTGRSLDNSESNPYAGKVVTVSDLVHFFNNQPKLNAT